METNPLPTSTAFSSAVFSVRCPQCLKLYRVQRQDVHSAKPRFECVVCQAHFQVETLKGEAKARTVKLPQLAQLQQARAVQSRQGHAMELKLCPKCQILNPQTADDCRKCGVVFRKLELMDGDPDLRPSLARAWRELLQDYQNVKKHFAFLDQCEDLQALPLALRKYEELKRLQPQDPLPRQMWLAAFQRAVASTQVLGWQKVDWSLVIRFGPYVLAIALIFSGLLHWGSPNLTGFGATVLLLAAGTRLFLHGKLT